MTDERSADHTNGEIKTFLSIVGGYDPEKIKGYLILLLDEDEKVNLISGAVPGDAAGRLGEMLLMMGAIAELAQRLALENQTYKRTLVQLGILEEGEE